MMSPAIASDRVIPHTGCHYVVHQFWKEWLLPKTSETTPSKIIHQQNAKGKHLCLGESSLVWMFANIRCSNAGYLACCCRRPFIQSRVHAADWLRPNNAFPTIELLIKSSDKASFSVSTDASSTFSWHLPDGSSASNGAINWHIRRTRTETSFLCNQFSSWAMHGLLILSYHYQRHNPLLARE